LYKTGDLGRYRADGSIEFLGRGDHQVKIRGHRIELGEIEACLHRHADVRQAVVEAREDVVGNRRIVAYLMMHHGAPKAGGDFRDFLKGKLPEFMVPSAFVILEKFPLTANGKVDRKALPSPEIRRAEEDLVSCRDTLDLQLANLWKKLLRIKTIGIRDNFFDLGGNSLLVARLFAHIEKEFGMSIPLATLFQAPSIEQLADIMRRRDGKQNWSSLVEIHPGGSGSPLFLVHGAEGNVLLYRELAKYLESKRPVYGLQSKGLDGQAGVFRNMEDMAASYIAEVESLQAAGPYYVGGYCLGGAIALEMARQWQAKGEQVGLVAMFETYNENSVQPLIRQLFWPVYFFQNIYFHWRNLLSLDAKAGRRFLRKKWQTSLSRFFIGVSDIVQNLRFWRSLPETYKYPHIRIKRTNDEAQRRYVPKVYAGRVALFKPRKYFAGSTDPRFGWGDVIPDGLEVYAFPFFPKAMLVEPFVRTLAERLESCLDKPPLANYFGE
jgi:thioesterase domain-containing protein/acyl carrier protein